MSTVVFIFHKQFWFQHTET